MIILTLLTLSAISMQVTAVPEDTKIRIKMLEPGGKRDMMDVLHVGVLQESAKGVALEWLGSQHNDKHPSTAMLFRKKYLGSEFLGKRNLGSEFLGKRADGLILHKTHQIQNLLKHQH
ncbi:uncharacterized protein LOC124171055 [Ischnura elegans]|uniref:uncharacterized protein LOC124171055 n=1 Tax=Ischnura elegans TaxID=197161 RepID=UPI001ED88278|nr:uncharacterized protein LOC124171055 [Ischnura elegans]